MTEQLNLKQAAELLAETSQTPRLKGDILGIIRAGAAGKIPVYWFNDLKISTCISNFKHDLPYTYSSGPTQLTHTSLREMVVAESTRVIDFQFTDQDYTLLEEMRGEAIDKDGNHLVYRHPATNDGIVTLSRDQLFVFKSDLQAYATSLAPPPPSAAQGTTPVQRQLAQEREILDCLKTMGLAPKNLPKHIPGISGTKAEVRKKLSKSSNFVGDATFDKAWIRLRAKEDVAESKT